ncbi:MAG: zf-HC2 domain-containing protein [Acidobacteria bacterium]|nr:zf-HC2 domain-containing protein [Acidobacteriota bacterium]
MDHPQIENERILDRYLVGQLSDEEEALFEEHLFACAECLEAVRWGEELRQGLRAVATEDAAKAAVAVGFWAWLRQRSSAQWAGALGFGITVVALGVVLVSTVLRQRAEIDHLRAAASAPPVEAPSGPSFDAPLGGLAVVALGTVRDAGGEPTEIRLDLDRKALLLSLELPTSTAERYQVTLSDAAGKVRWRGDDLEPTPYDTIPVVLPVSFLEPGEYQVEVRALGAPAEEPGLTMTFRVAGPP